MQYLTTNILQDGCLMASSGLSNPRSGRLAQAQIASIVAHAKRQVITALMSWEDSRSGALSMLTVNGGGGTCLTIRPTLSAFEKIVQIMRQVRHGCSDATADF